MSEGKPTTKIEELERQLQDAMDRLSRASRQTEAAAGMMMFRADKRLERVRVMEEAARARV